MKDYTIYACSESANALVDQICNQLKTPTKKLEISKLFISQIPYEIKMFICYRLVFRRLVNVYLS